MKKFDIVPFALPNCPPGEIWFEESRDIREVVVHFKHKAPRQIRVHYLQDKWPGTRHEERHDTENPAAFGWVETDDWFNGQWRQAKVIQRVTGKTVTLRFRGLLADRIEGTPKDYDVQFRRTMALQLTVPDGGQIRKTAVHTTSAPTSRLVRIELDAGKRTRGKHLKVSGYNARITAIGSHRGMTAIGPGEVTLGKGRKRFFLLKVEHMIPTHRYCGDSGLVEFHLDHDTFTVSLEALDEQGPIWYAEEGLFVTRANEPTAFAEYRREHAAGRTVNQRVAGWPEHSYARAFLGQPRPHAVAYSLGCKHSPQRFWLEPNGDLVLHKDNLTRLTRPGGSAARFLNQGNARFFFSLEEWTPTARFTDPPPVLGYHLGFRQRSLHLEQEGQLPFQVHGRVNNIALTSHQVAHGSFRVGNDAEYQCIEGRQVLICAEVANILFEGQVIPFDPLLHHIWAPANGRVRGNVHRGKLIGIELVPYMLGQR